MKKTRMNLDDLLVQSFYVTPSNLPAPGTVRGYWDEAIGEPMPGEDVMPEDGVGTIVRTCKDTCCKTCGYTCDDGFTCSAYSLVGTCPNEIPVSSK